MLLDISIIIILVILLLKKLKRDLNANSKNMKNDVEEKLKNIVESIELSKWYYFFRTIL